MDLLRNHRLHISNIEKQEDSFEKTLECIDAEDSRRTEVQDTMCKQYGFISYTVSDSNPLHWEKYARRRTGVAFEFFYPIETLPILKKIHYGVPHTKFSKGYLEGLSQEDYSNMMDVLIENHLQFKDAEQFLDEEEWRQIFVVEGPMTSPNVVREPSGYFYYFDKKCLRRIILGSSSTVSCRQVKGMLDFVGGYDHVEVLLSGVSLG